MKIQRVGVGLGDELFNVVDGDGRLRTRFLKPDRRLDGRDGTYVR